MWKRQIEHQAMQMKSAAALAAVLLAASLVGCTTTEEKLAGYYAEPGKYKFYPCAALAILVPPLKEREQELRALMAKAERGPGGGLVSAVAYRNDLLATRGELMEIERTAASKNCPPLRVPKPAGRRS